MASEPQALSGAERIRSLKTEDDIFKAFDSYPWAKDKNFMVRTQKLSYNPLKHMDFNAQTTYTVQSGLYAILGNPSTNNPQASLDDMATHARIFYYTQKIGVTIDFSQYTAWLASHPDHQPPNVLPKEYTQGPTPTQEPALDWQKAAPKADLWVDKKAAPSAEGDQPSYPIGFAEMIKLLQEGKPVPGVKSIPNTIVRDPVSHSMHTSLLHSLKIAGSQARRVEGSSEEALGKGGSS